MQRLLRLKEVLSILTCLLTLSSSVRLLTIKGGVSDKMAASSNFQQLQNTKKSSLTLRYNLHQMLALEGSYY